jgi:hypothetical protein
VQIIFSQGNGRWQVMKYSSQYCDSTKKTIPSPPPTYTDMVKYLVLGYMTKQQWFEGMTWEIPAPVCGDHRGGGVHPNQRDRYPEDRGRIQPGPPYYHKKCPALCRIARDHDPMLFQHSADPKYSQQNLKIFKSMNQGPRWYCLLKKARGEKSRDTVSLSILLRAKDKISI